jgi:hypothetical protein
MDRDTNGGSASAGRPEDLNAFCQTGVELVQLVLSEGGIPGETASKKEIAAFQEDLAELLDRAVQTAPAEIAVEVGYAAEITRIDPRSAAELPGVLEILEPIQTIKQFMADNCGFETVVVTAREYELQGIPEAIEIGTVVFEFRNEGAEVHEMLFGRIRGDASLEALLTLPEEVRLAQNQIEELGAGAVAGPGASDVALVEFTRPGRYAVACFVPVGTTSVEAPAIGAPHTHEGMFTEFRVEAER